VEVVKKTDDYKVVKKRSGRFGVLKKNGSWVNGDEKVKILLSAGLIKVNEPKAKPEEPAAGPSRAGGCPLYT
jgi:hypothetical protein